MFTLQKKMEVRVMYKGSEVYSSWPFPKGMKIDWNSPAIQRRAQVAGSANDAMTGQPPSLGIDSTVPDPIGLTGFPTNGEVADFFGGVLKRLLDGIEERVIDLGVAGIEYRARLAGRVPRGIEK